MSTHFFLDFTNMLDITYSLLWYISVPVLSRFLGIAIAMYINDHNPPHFHVKYNEFRAMNNIRTLGVIEGALPPRDQGLVIE